MCKPDLRLHATRNGHVARVQELAVFECKRSILLAVVPVVHVVQGNHPCFRVHDAAWTNRCNFLQDTVQLRPQAQKSLPIVLQTSVESVQKRILCTIVSFHLEGHLEKHCGG